MLYLASLAALATVSPAEARSRPAPSIVLQAETRIAPASAAQAIILRIGYSPNWAVDGARPMRGRTHAFRNGHEAPGGAKQNYDVWRKC